MKKAESVALSLLFISLSKAFSPASAGLDIIVIVEVHFHGFVDVEFFFFL